MVSNSRRLTGYLIALKTVVTIAIVVLMGWNIRAVRDAARTFAGDTSRQEPHAAAVALNQSSQASRSNALATIDAKLDRVKVLSLVLAGVFLLGGVFTSYLLKKYVSFTREEARSSHLQRLILSAVGEGVLGLDASGKTIFANAAAERILGFSESEMLGKHQHSLIHHSHPDGSPYPVEDCPIYKALIDGGTYRSDNECLWTKSGTPVTVDLVSTPVVINGAISGVVQAFRDITQKRRDEKALQESQQSLRDMFERMPIGLYRSTPGGRILEGNPELLKVLGFSDKVALQAFDARDLYVNAEARAAWMAGVSAGSADSFDAQLRRQDGEIIWVRSSVRALRYENDDIKYFDGAIQNITDQKNAEAALLESESSTRAILSATRDAFIATDAGGRIIQWNESATRTFGWTAEEAIGQTVSETIIPPQHRAAHLRGMERVAQSVVPEVLNQRMEMTALHRDGREFPVEFTITAVPGKTLVITSFLRDITERLQLAEHVRQAQKLEAMGGLAGGVAHDFNNLLTIIRVNLEWLGDVIPPESQRDLQEISKATDKAQSLTQQLLAYSRKQFLQPTPTNLNGIVGSVDTMLRRLVSEDVEIVSLLDPSLATVSVDRAQIEQVITNLAINARDAMPKGGRIIIETRNVEILINDPLFETAAPGNYVFLSVSDDGDGMSADVKSRAFEPFFTTKGVGKGTGLGLAMVHGIVKQSGGDIHLESHLGLGTALRLIFPQIQGTVLETGATAKEGVPRGGERVLLVEDQVAVRQVARRILDSLGYVVYEAANGEDALTRFRALSGQIDLVLTDLVMPKMGGRELARHLRVEWPHTKVLFMSGYSSETASGSTLEAEAVGLLKKPFSRDTLAIAVRTVLDAGSE